MRGRGWGQVGLWSRRQLKVIRKGEDSGPQWGLLCARHGPGACNTLAPWARCCILTSQMWKQAQKDEGAYLGSHSQPVAVGLGFRPRSEDLETCLEFAVSNWEVVEKAGPQVFPAKSR